MLSRNYMISMLSKGVGGKPRKALLAPRDAALEHEARYILQTNHEQIMVWWTRCLNVDGEMVWFTLLVRTVGAEAMCRN